MTLSTCCDMLPPYTAILLHLSFLLAPTVTAAWHCLPIQLSDGRDSIKSRVITMRGVSCRSMLEIYAVSTLCILSLTSHLESCLVGSTGAEPKGHPSYTRTSSFTLRCGIHISQNLGNMLEGNILSRIHFSELLAFQIQTNKVSQLFKSIITHICFEHRISDRVQSHQLITSISSLCTSVYFI